MRVPLKGRSFTLLMRVWDMVTPNLNFCKEKFVVFTPSLRGFFVRSAHCSEAGMSGAFESFVLSGKSRFPGLLHLSQELPNEFLSSFLKITETESMRKRFSFACRKRDCGFFSICEFERHGRVLFCKIEKEILEILDIYLETANQR